MVLGASRLKRAVLVLVVVLCASLGFLSCGSSKPKKPPSGLNTRVLVSQGVSASFAFGGLVMVNGKNDTLPRVGEISAGTNPGLMTLSPTRATLLAFDSASQAIQIVNTTTESNVGRVQLAGSTTSMVIPATTTIGYAAVPTASFTGWNYPAGAVEMLNLSSGAATPILVTKAQTVISNQNGTQLLVFSNDSDSVSVISPLLAVGPVDPGCDSTPPTAACLNVVGGFDRPVFGIISGSTAYILNCGAECGGTQASVQTLDLGTMIPSTPVPVDAATVAVLSGSQLYVAGTSPTNNSCSGQTTAATICGRLDVVDISTNPPTVTNSVVITDGYHDHIDISNNGQLFIGAHTCTNVGNVNNPSGEVRGCLAIFDTTKAGNTAAVIPPDNGDVTGLQSFSSRNVEYVGEGGNLRIYDTTKNLLQKTQLTISGQVIDVKAIDFF
jgi:hypothetical protein